MECYVRMSYENAAFYRHACSWSSGIFRRGLVGVKTSSMTWRKFFHHVISSHHLQSRTMILALLCIILPALNLPRRLQRLDLGIYGASTLNPVRWETMALTLSSHTHTHTHTRLIAFCPGLPRWAGTRKVKPIWILLKHETVSGSGINWAIWVVVIGRFWHRWTGAEYETSWRTIGRDDSYPVLGRSEP